MSEKRISACALKAENDPIGHFSRRPREKRRISRSEDVTHSLRTRETRRGWRTRATIRSKGTKKRWRTNDGARRLLELVRGSRSRAGRRRSASTSEEPLAQRPPRALASHDGRGRGPRGGHREGRRASIFNSCTCTFAPRLGGSRTGARDRRGSITATAARVASATLERAFRRDLFSTLAPTPTPTPAPTPAPSRKFKRGAPKL